MSPIPARLPEPTSKFTVRFANRDLAMLEHTYGTGKVNKVIREIVERHCDGLRERLAGLRT